MSHTNATEQEVLDLTGSDASMSEVTPHLDWAKRLVADALEDEGIANATLTDIEKYLAAHSLSARDQDIAVDRASVGDASARFTGEFEVGLGATRWGQMAMDLDPSGTLKARQSTSKGVKWKIGVYD